MGQVSPPPLQGIVVIVKYHIMKVDKIIISWMFFIYIHEYITNLQNDQLPVGLVDSKKNILSYW